MLRMLVFHILFYYACESAARRKPQSRAELSNAFDRQPNASQKRNGLCSSGGQTFQFVVGASRRRAAPRGQTSCAALVAQCHFIGYRGPLTLHQRSALDQTSAPATKMKTFICPVFGRTQRYRAVRPNRSLNRTLHSMPAFGQAFHASPNATMLFRAG